MDKSTLNLAVVYCSPLLAVARLAFAAAASLPLRADVVINEFMSSNGSTLADEDGSYEDWIELHNTGSESADLTDWGLSDNNSNPFKWRLPAGTTIAPGGHLVIWASAKDRQPGVELPGILREVWLGIPGSDVANLTSHPSFPDSPSSANRITDFIETPSNFADHYGQRLRGVLTAPDTGNYRFWIASDDSSELRLGSNENPASATLIASVSGWTSPRQWNKYGSQQSALIPLVAGQRYHLEILMKEGSSADNLALRWQLPDGAIEEPMPAHYFASPTTGQLHAGFRVSSAGEPLTLSRPDGTTADHVPATYVPRDISFGRLTDGSTTWHYFAAATPGAPNTSPPVTLPPTVTISEPRGFRNAPFSVTLSASDPAATIRYTLDGSTPGPASPVYTSPLPITGTTTLRASAVEPGMIQLPPATATWLFLDDILQQGSTTPPGWPANRAVNNHAMEYGLRPEIVTNDNQRLRQGMMSIPSISLVTDLDHLFGSGTGIYSYSNQSHGWERPVSVELIDPDGNPDSGFQIDAGLRLRGAFSRSVDNPKHSFRLLFRSAYGEKRLEFPLFEDEGTTSFDRIDLRTSQNYSWAFSHDNRNTFLREVFSRDSQRDMGMPHTRSRYYHLYLNGQYWGLYMTQERGEADWAATYLGGDSDDWDTIKTSQPGYVTQAADGNFAAFHSLHDITVNQGFSGANANNYWRVRGLNPDGTPNPGFPVLVDQDNLIHYMLVAHYTGDPDSPISIWGGFPNNLYALYNRANPDGFKWLRHDAEHSLGAHDGYGVTTDTTAAGINLTAQHHFNPALLHWQLCQHPEYRMRVADVMQRHLYANGSLTPANAKARIQSRLDRIDTAIIGESARWGRGRTRDATWLPACNAVLSYLDQRRDIVVSQYRNRGWFPSINAPTASVEGPTVRIAAETPFYYMTDGTDPRLAGGGIHPDAVLVDQQPVFSSPVALIPRGATWRYYDLGSAPPVLNGMAWNHPDYPASSWPSGPAILGFAGANPQNPVATQTKRWVSGNSGPQVTTTYLRHEFTLGSAGDFSSLVTEILRDDGAVIYLNGVEIHRENMPSGPIGYSTLASSVVGGSDQTTWFARQSAATHLLRPGVNVLAASVHQIHSTSSDKYFGLSLAATPGPQTLDLPAHLAPSFRARGYLGGEWSALSDGSSLDDLPDPVTIHEWNFEISATYLDPSFTVGGGAALAVAPGPLTEVLRNTPAQDFPTAHLRVNNPLGSTLTWSLPSTGFGALTLAWETRRSGQGAGTQTVEFTTDGSIWLPLDSYPVFDAAPQFRSFDFTGYSAAENNPQLAVRVTFSQGEGGTAGNNRFDNVILTGVALPGGNPPASIIFGAAPAGTASGAPLAPVLVRLLDADGNPAISFNGPVTLSLSGAGGLTGTLTVDAVNGTATFDDLTLTGTGSYQLVANAAGLEPTVSTTFRSLSLTSLILPRFIQGDQDALLDNNDRVPFAWRARIDGLEPDATYRFGNRVVLPADTPTNDGAGNMIFITSSTQNWIRTTESPRFRPADLGTRHFSFTAGPDGSFTGWFLTEPSGNARFTPGNTVRFRLLLNDGDGGEETTYHLTTAESAQVIRFGTSPGDGSAIIGESPTAARRIAVLYDETAGVTRPLAATPVEITGAAVDLRYAAFYQNIVATNQSHWGTILPNALPGGLRRIEFRSATGEAALLDTRLHANGFPGTVNPTGGNATPILLDADAGLPVFLPGDSATWHTPVNWSTGLVPNAAGAQAIVNAPTTADRNVNINSAATIGTLRVNQAATPFRNRIRNNHADGTLTFHGGGGPATLRGEGAGGTGHVDLDFSNPVTLAGDLILLVNQADGGDPQHGALRLQQIWSGPGGLIKQGPGMVTLTGEGKSFTGALVIEQGALRVTGPAVPAATSGVTILPGGQLRLVSTGTPADPRVHTFGGGPVHIGGLGRGGDLPPGQELGVLGALRYDPGTQDNLATLTNPLALTATTDLHIDGTRNTLRLDGPVTGNGHAILKTGGGTLELAAASPLPAPPIDVETGMLAVTASHPAAIHLTTGTRLTGSGPVGSISGGGTVSPGAETLTATASSAASLAAVLANPGAAGNGALALTDATEPLPAAPQTIDLFLDPAAPLQPGDRLQGGLIVPAGIDLTGTLAATTIHLFLADPAGGIDHLGQTYRAVTAADPLSVSIAGRTLEVLQGGTPTAYGQWRNLHFADPAARADDAISGPAATDPAGTANLFRYAFGLGLQDPVAAAMPQADPATDTFRFAFDPAKPDLAWIVRASPDLTDWSETLFDSRHHTPPAAGTDGLTPIPYPADRRRLFLRLELLLIGD